MIGSRLSVEVCWNTSRSALPFCMIFFMTVVGFLHGSQMAFHFLVAMPMELP